MNQASDMFRPVVPGCAGCAMAHPDFARSVNPISTRGTDYAHLITTCTPGFSDLPTALYYRHYLHCQLKICAPPQAIGKTMSYKEFTKKKELQSE